MRHAEAAFGIDIPDTRLGLALILALVSVPLVLALLVNGMRDLPLEIEEAARMDGATTLAVLSSSCSLCPFRSWPPRWSWPSSAAGTSSCSS